MEALRRSVGQAAPAEAPQEVAEGGYRPEGNAAVDRGQEAREGGRRQGVGNQAAAQVGLGRTTEPRRLLSARQGYRPQTLCG
jgi:hypothetical protein